MISDHHGACVLQVGNWRTGGYGKPGLPVVAYGHGFRPGRGIGRDDLSIKRHYEHPVLRLQVSAEEDRSEVQKISSPASIPARTRSDSRRRNRCAAILVCDANSVRLPTSDPPALAL
jgi:hypothetical protein